MTAVYIPTLGRVNRQETLKSIPAEWRQFTALVAHPNEVERLAAGHPDITVLSCPAQGHGIAAVRQWILDNADDAQMIMMDDDFRFATRRPDDPGKFVKGADVGAALSEILSLLTSYPMVGLAHRSGANRLQSPVKTVGRVHGVIGVDVPLARQNGWRFDRMKFMEDFDFALQVLTSGYANAIYTDVVYDQGSGSNAAGGCSLQRTAVGQAAAAVDLALEWPEFVTVVQKEAKGGGEWSDRVDVRVQWAKSYAHGQES